MSSSSSNFKTQRDKISSLSGDATLTSEQSQKNQGHFEVSLLPGDHLHLPEPISVEKMHEHKHPAHILESPDTLIEEESPDDEPVKYVSGHEHNTELHPLFEEHTGVVQEKGKIGKEYEANLQSKLKNKRVRKRHKDNKAISHDQSQNLPSHQNKGNLDQNQVQTTNIDQFDKKVISDDQKANVPISTLEVKRQPKEIDPEILQSVRDIGEWSSPIGSKKRILTKSTIVENAEKSPIVSREKRGRLKSLQDQEEQWHEVKPKRFVENQAKNRKKRIVEEGDGWFKIISKVN